MTEKTIRRLKIENFKSIDSLEVKGLAPFSVFAGANGSGKSNFFDALDFVSLFVRGGLEIARHEHGGFANIQSKKREGEDAKTFSFEIECDLLEKQKEMPTTFLYLLSSDFLDSDPKIEEYLYVNGERSIERIRSKFVHYENGTESLLAGEFPSIYSVLPHFPTHPLTKLLRNLHVYRIDPTGAKEPDKSDLDPTMQLERKGNNLASVLHRLEGDEAIREEIQDWMEMIVPGIENIQTEHQRLDGSTAVRFKEEGIENPFPAHLVSDGTMHALCLLVAVLDAPSGCGITLIEEPERGLHPKAIRKLIDLMRQQASSENPIWLTTHSESVVRALKLSEFVLVDKIDGRTTMKSADDGNISQEDLAPLGLDEAWLSNLLAGGIPW